MEYHLLFAAWFLFVNHLFFFLNVRALKGTQKESRKFFYRAVQYDPPLLDGLLLGD